MSRGVNKVILVGHVGQDPEVKYMPSGKAVANLTLATSESWKDRDSGEKEERTEWHRLVIFNKLAEIAGEYVKKGSQLYIEGSLRTRKYKGKDQQEHYITEIVVSEMQMLGGRQTQAAASRSESSGSAAPMRMAAGSDMAPSASDLPFDDDIPF